MLPLFILAPLAVVVLANLPLGTFLRRGAWSLALALAIAQATVLIAVPAQYWSGGSYLDRFFALSLTTDNLSCVMLLAVAVATIAALLVGRSTIAGFKSLSNYTSVVLIGLIGMNGTVLLSSLFSLWVFIEVSSVASFILIAMNRDRAGLEGAFKYIIVSSVATLLMLTGVALLMLVGRGDLPLSFGSLHDALAATHGLLVVKFAVGAFVCGLFIKAGIVPFHGWLPGAYSSAPPGASVLLAGIVTKASGVYALVRLVTTVFPQSAELNNVLLIAGAASIVVGALAALYQSDLKRLLAYSSISQVGYIVLGLGCGTALGVIGAVFHLFNHAVFKSLLFVNAAAVEQQAGTTDTTRLGGLGSRMPWTNATSLIGALSTAGIPPLSGFWSKLIIVVALWQAGHFGWAVLAVMMSVVTLGYLLVMQRRVFFGKTPEPMAAVREAKPGIVLASVILAGVTVGMGVLFFLVIDTFVIPVKTLF